MQALEDTLCCLNLASLMPTPQPQLFPGAPDGSLRMEGVVPFPDAAQRVSKDPFCPITKMRYE